jgi:Protein of unknown function (DUF4230)
MFCLSGLRHYSDYSKDAYICPSIMSKKIVQIAALTLAFIIGGWLTYQFFVPKQKATESSTVLLEKIRAVCKLVTVEGQFSEIYNYDEYEGYFSMFWDKKILVRARATVAAGYDLEKMTVEADQKTKTIYLKNIPPPQILSIDHSLDYYDISNGLFTSFSEADYNRINQRAKDLIRDQAEKSRLLDAAQEQAVKVFDLIRFMAESNGWTVAIEGQPDLKK